MEQENEVTEQPNPPQQEKPQIVIPDGTDKIIDLQKLLQDLDQLTLESTVMKIKNIFKDPTHYRSLAHMINIFSVNRFTQQDVISELAYQLAVNDPTFSLFLYDESHGMLLRRLFEKGLFTLEQIQTKCERNNYQYLFFIPEIQMPKNVAHQPSVINFEKHFKFFAQNDFQLYREWLRYGFAYDSIQYAVQTRNQAFFQEFINSQGFSIDETFTDTPFCPFTGYKDNFFPERRKFTLLAIAAFFGNYSFFKQLLKLNAKVDEIVCKCAIRGGNLDILELCKQYGGTFENGLEIAVSCHQNHVFDWLVSNIDSLRDKMPSLESIAKSGNILVAILFLSSGGDPKQGEDFRRPPLLRAAELGHDFMLKLLVENGCTPTVVTEYGDCALHLAAKLGHIDTIRYLLDKGCSATLANPKGWTPLHNAARNDNVDVVKLFIEKGADVNASTITGHSVLHISLLNNCFQVANCLLDFKANPNTKSTDGRDRTPLTVAISKNQVQLAKRMVELGADVNTRADITSPLALAVQLDNQELITYLKSHGALDLPNKEKDGTIIIPPAEKVVLKPPYDAKGHDHYGRTLLMNACECGQLDEVTQLVKDRSDINAKDCNGCTPLIIATMNKHEDVANYLIQRGADVDAKNKSNRTALHYAAENDLFSIVKSLKQKGAYMNPASKHVGTPKSIAKSQEMKDLIAKFGGV